MKKDRQEIMNDLTDAVAIIGREIHQISDFKLGVQSISTQLCKILYNSGDPLLLKVFPNALLHPLKHKTETSKYLMSDGISKQFTEDGGLILSCFEETTPSIYLKQWEEQILIVNNGIELTIRDIIVEPRNKVSAHFNSAKFNKVEAFKKFFKMTIGGREYSSYEVILCLIGAYIIKRVNELIVENEKDIQ